MRFVDLSHRASILTPTKREKVRRFIEGLTYGIRLEMAREAESETSFSQVIDIG